MSEQSPKPDKVYIPDTKEVDIDYAIRGHFFGWNKPHQIIHEVFKAENDDDIPERTERMYEYIQALPLVDEKGRKLGHWEYSREKDTESGCTLLKLNLYYVHF